ncbi:MAG: NADH-quinone oxidoreductase subunit NuoF [Bacteriovoracaceae bacterium]|nr:NADH-quinone oxidoreductase subunit NuoF [Bacteriovoracaceae bacterium]
MNAQNFEIIVGAGTCGIAAGSQDVYNAFKEKLPNANLHSVGCIGMCHREVLAQIKVDQNQSYLYGDLTKKNVSKVIDYHMGQGELPQELLITSSDDKEKINDYLGNQTRIALRNVGKLDPTSLDDYTERGGHKALKKILQDGMTPEQVIEEIKTSGLRGRGGAGFPTFMKWQFARNTKASEKYLICNGDEGDPGAFMDRSLLEGDPHNVLEGMLVAAYAIGASKGYAYIRAEYPLAVKNFTKAIEDATKAGLLGKNIMGSDFSFEVKVKQGAGAFVCGEETALIASIEGERGMPRIRPPFPAVKGVFERPTIINNVETLSNLPWIIVHGGKEYASYGTEDSKGTKVFALAGAIRRGGLVEIPMGMTIREVLEKVGGGSKTGRPLKAVQLGGPSGGCVPEKLFDTEISYKAINATGAIMGSGGMIVMDDSTCMVDLAKYFLDFTQLESCGKCTFCRIGTIRMKEILTRICDGEGVMEDIDTLEDLAAKIKDSSLCGLGQTAPNPVLTTLKYFKDEYIGHIQDKTCKAAVCKKLITHTIVQETCIACSLCKKGCPVDAITGQPKKLGTFKINQETCINCGMCVEVCRDDSILVK